MAPIPKCPYLKSQKKSPTPAPVPQAAAPAPVPLVAINKAVTSSGQHMTNHIMLTAASTPANKEYPPSFLPCPHLL